MIAWLSGRLLRKTADSVVIDVGGVGYQLSVPLSASGGIPEPGGEIALHVHTHLREDSLSLYGFPTELEKEVFLLLMNVAGIGPKLALSVMSGLSVEDLLSAIRSGDDALLCSIPGIGKKTAARLCLELKDRVGTLAPGDRTGAPAGGAALADRLADAASALVNLGYRRQQAEEAVQKIDHARPGIRVEDLVREALSLLVKR